MRNLLNEKRTIRTFFYFSFIILLIFIVGIIIGNYMALSFCENAGIKILKRIANGEIPLDKLIGFLK